VATEHNKNDNEEGVESAYAWTRLALALLLSTIGGVGMWSVVVALPAVQAEFGVARADASLPYTLTMIGFGIGGILLGRLSDRAGIVPPLLIGAVALALGYAAAGASPTLWYYGMAQGVLIGFGSSATFAPLLADTSHWFTRNRGIAVGITSPAPSGRRWCSTSSRRPAGATPASASRCSASSPCCRSR
jgi:MFS family permease